MSFKDYPFLKCHSYVNLQLQLNLHTYLIFSLVLLITESKAIHLTNYEYYSQGSIKSGLSADQPFFTLNNVNITIISGSIHYFRVPRPYWRDRLKKLRAAGFNTVSTYVPWNLHEPSPGFFDFGRGTFDFGNATSDSKNVPSHSENAPSDSKSTISDMSDFLDLHHFLELARQEDLFAIVRPGPYICSELDFGGLPSWLLRDKQMVVRSSQINFMRPVTRYFNVLMPILAKLQFTRGGPIIALQVENEFASLHRPDEDYLMELMKLMVNNGIVELLLTSDLARSGTVGSLPEHFLLTANFQDNPLENFYVLKRLQRDRPLMAMEFYTGWFDRWARQHSVVDPKAIAIQFEDILRYPASVNLYMFHGGTNWGFLNGAIYKSDSLDNEGFQPETTSYDYDAPLDEAGNYTEKYFLLREIALKFNHPAIKVMDVPEPTRRFKFRRVSMSEQLTLDEVLMQIPERFESFHTIPMELLPIGNVGQSYGYIVYRKKNVTIPAKSTLKIVGRVCDTVMVLINGVLASRPLEITADLNGFGYWTIKNSKLFLGRKEQVGVTLDLVVENWGRVHFGNIDQYKQHKGLWQGGIYINEEVLTDWEIIPLEFKTSWNRALENWHQPVVDAENPTPSIYKFNLQVETPMDTFIDMREWTKGIVIVNGFVLGRYCFIGPQQTLYFPAPLQKLGANEILVFEHFEQHSSLMFSEDAIFEAPFYETFTQEEKKVEEVVKSDNLFWRYLSIQLAILLAGLYLLVSCWLRRFVGKKKVLGMVKNF